MRSVADDVRAEQLRDERHRTPAERLALALALELGDQDLEAFRTAHGLDVAAAHRLLQRRRQVGRQPSRCLDDLLL
jgi:hypothetical protein